MRLLLAFMGAAMGWAYSWRVFVNSALLAYMAGVSAQDLMDQVSQQEFSQAGTMFKAAASATIQSEKINAEAFARSVPAHRTCFPCRAAPFNATMVSRRTANYAPGVLPSSRHPRLPCTRTSR